MLFRATQPSNPLWRHCPYGETVLRTSMLVLTSLLAAAISSATPPTCPAAADLPALLGVPADAPCDCLLGRQGRRVVACIELDKTETRVKVLVVHPSGASARAEFPLDGPEAADIAALKVEDWVVKVSEQALGDRETIRVNVSAGAGDDLFIGQEVVTFLAFEGNKLARLWTGLGGKVDRRFDSCFLFTEARSFCSPTGGCSGPSRPSGSSRRTASPGIWRARCARSASPHPRRRRSSSSRCPWV